MVPSPLSRVISACKRLVIWDGVSGLGDVNLTQGNSMVKVNPSSTIVIGHGIDIQKISVP